MNGQVDMRSGCACLGVRQPRTAANLLGAAFVAIANALLGGCSAFLSAAPPSPYLYSLDNQHPVTQSSVPSSGVAPTTVVIVAAPRAVAGFSTDRIVYVRAKHLLETYADSQWVDTPARMIGPLIAESLSQTRRFAAVLTAPSPAYARWELGTEIVRLQYDVPEARVRFTLRATLIDKRTRSAVMTRIFEASASTPSVNPAGVVVAANAAVADVLDQLAQSCAMAIQEGP